MPNWAIGLILIVVVGVGSVVAYTKKLPWGDPYEVQAVFETAQNLRPKAPVRIAGINVGEVTKVEHLTAGDPALQAQADGQEAHAARRAGRGAGGGPGDDGARRRRRCPCTRTRSSSCARACSWRATSSSTPSPAARTPRRSDEDHTFPVTQTSSSVQIDQVLTTLQSDVRANLQTFLDQFGNALIEVRRRRRASRSSTAPRAGAFKYTSQVNEALQGTRTARPLGPDRQPRPGRRRARLERARAAGPGHQPARRLGLVRRRVGLARAGDREAARRPRRGPAGLRQPERLVPAAARLRARGAAGRALDRAGAARGDAADRAGAAAGLRAASCAAWSPTCARRSPTWPGCRPATKPLPARVPRRCRAASTRS